MTDATTETFPREAPARHEGRPSPYRIPVGLYERMVDAYVFGDTSPVYLWDGSLVEPRPRTRAHGYTQTALNACLRRFETEGWHARYAAPVKVSEYSFPEPDFSVVRGSTRDYKDRHPAAPDVMLLIEVADETLSFDAGEKLRAYARSFIPVYWVVNLPESRIEVYARPRGPAEAIGYADRATYSPGEAVPVVLDGREVGRVSVSDVLG